MSWASSCFIVSTTTDTTMRMPVPPRREVLEAAADGRPMNGGHGDDAQEERAGDRDAEDDPGQVVLGRAPGPDAGDEAAVLAQLLGRLIGLEREGRVEVGEADGQQEVQADVQADRAG